MLLYSLAEYVGSIKPEFNPKRVIPPEAYQNLVLALSDTQLILGTAFIISGLIERCTVTQYHFAIAVWLVNISFASHQSSFMVLSDYFSDRSTISYLRVLWITAFTACTLFELITVWSNLFLAPRVYGMRVQCVWDDFSAGYDSSNLATVCIFTILTVWGCLEMLSTLMHVNITAHTPTIFLRAVRAVRRALWQPYNLMAKASVKFKVAAFKSTPPWKKIPWETYHLLCSILFVLVFSLKRLLPSRSFNLIRIFTFLIYGTLSVFRLRKNATENGLSSDEDE